MVSMYNHFGMKAACACRYRTKHKCAAELSAIRFAVRGNIFFWLWEESHPPMGNETTPKPLLGLFGPLGGFIPLGSGFVPPLRERGLSRFRGGFIPPAEGGGVTFSGVGGMAHLNVKQESDCLKTCCGMPMYSVDPLRPTRSGRGYKTTPKSGIKPLFWPFWTPGVVLCHLGVVLFPLLQGLLYPPKGVVLSPHWVIGGVLSPFWGGFIPHFW